MTTQEAVYAGFGRRTAAGFIDLIIMIILWAVCTFLPVSVEIQNAAYYLIAAAYYILLEGSQFCATVGKKLLGIKVLTRNGARPSMAQIVRRYFFFILASLPISIYTMTPDFVAFEQQTAVLSNMDTQAFEAFMNDPANAPYAKKLDHYNLFMLVSIVAICTINWLPIAFTREKTALQDALSGTRVFKVKE